MRSSPPPPGLIDKILYLRVLFTKLNRSSSVQVTIITLNSQSAWHVGGDPFNQHSDRSDREKWSTSKCRPVFSKLFWLDRTDPLSFGPKFPEILVEWIAPVQSHSWHVKVLDFAPWRGWYVREFELSDSTLISRIIKIAHAHNLHVKMLDFALFYN